MTERLAVDWAGMFDAPGPHNEATTNTGGISHDITQPEPTAPIKDNSTRDDRRFCADCKRLSNSLRCNAPAVGLLVASRKYEPCQTMPRRCVAYLPDANDPDQTPGDVRWPWLKDAL